MGAKAQRIVNRNHVACLTESTRILKTNLNRFVIGLLTYPSSLSTIAHTIAHPQSLLSLCDA